MMPGPACLPGSPNWSDTPVLIGGGEAGGLCCLCHHLFWDTCCSKPASVSSALGWTPGN